MTSNNKINEDNRKLGLKAFYSAMETIGYESVIYEGKPTFHINMPKMDLMKELSLVLDNTYITMLILAMENEPKKENLHLSRKFVESLHEHLQVVTMDLMDKILDDEKEIKTHDNR